MTGKRVHEYAKELGIESEELISRLAENGIEAENHLSTVLEKDIKPLRPELYRHKDGPISVKKLAEKVGLSSDFIEESVRILKNDPQGEYKLLKTDIVKTLIAPQRSLRVEELGRRLHLSPKKTIKLLTKIERSVRHSRSKVDPITINVLEKVQATGAMNYVKNKRRIELIERKEEKSAENLPSIENDIHQPQIDQEFIMDKKIEMKYRFWKNVRSLVRPAYIILLIIILILTALIVFNNQIAYENYLKLTSQPGKTKLKSDAINIGAPLTSTTELPVSPKNYVVTKGAFAWLIIPRLDVSVPVLEGATTDNLMEGPAYSTTSSEPGEGLTIFYGFQSGENAPFANLDLLDDGDIIAVYTRDEGFIYQVGMVENTLLFQSENQPDGSATLKLVTAEGYQPGLIRRETSANLQRKVSEL